MQNTEVTRKTAKGDIITELVRGRLERVPRIISIRNLDPTYIVVDSARMDRAWVERNGPHFTTLAEAIQKRAQQRDEVEKLAALTHADIEEVHVSTLADILERDADKINALEAEYTQARKEFDQLEKQAEASIAADVANLERQIAATRTMAAELFGVTEAKKKFDAAVQAHNKAIHYDELEEEVLEKMHQEHGHDCWPNSDCRVAGECTYEPEWYEIEEYLLEHAEDFEVEEVADEENGERKEREAA